MKSESHADGIELRALAGEGYPFPEGRFLRLLALTLLQAGEKSPFPQTKVVGYFRAARI
ncbi:MAG: hypothetical protein P8Z30_15890 [Acidobacteriota bacterium]